MTLVGSACEDLHVLLGFETNGCSTCVALCMRGGFFLNLCAVASLLTRRSLDASYWSGLSFSHCFLEQERPSGRMNRVFEAL